MSHDRIAINHFLVDVFNEILKTEETLVTNSEFQNLSLREIHVIEAVCNAEDNLQENQSSAIASVLRVTAGTLTTSVTLLEKKGYLIRNKDTKDKRIVRISSTELGRKANSHHMQFHEQMVNHIINTLSEEEAAIFVRALSEISIFFHNQYLKIK